MNTFGRVTDFLRNGVQLSRDSESTFQGTALAHHKVDHALLHLALALLNLVWACLLLVVVVLWGGRWLSMRKLQNLIKVSSKFVHMFDKSHAVLLAHRSFAKVSSWLRSSTAVMRPVC